VRVRAALLHPPPQLVVGLDVHGAPAVRARGRDLHSQALVSQAPLHEGRGEGILRSSTENLLAGAEPQPVRRRFAGYGKGPAHLAARIADQKEQVPLQVVHQALHHCRLQPQRAGDLRRAERLSAMAGQFAHHEIAHGTMLGRQERQWIVHGIILPRYINNMTTAAP